MGDRRRCSVEVQRRLRDRLAERPLPPCPVCGNRPQLVTGKTLFPRSAQLHAQKFWRCPAGCSHVGCHVGTDIPLGTLATAAMRRARREAHLAFDAVWKMSGMRRPEAYAELARRLGIPVEQCHVAEFDEVRCAQVIAICADW